MSEVPLLTNLISGLKLSSKENNSVINSLNQAVSEQIGSEKRPNAKLCDK